jgi:hypothetical protein
MKQMETRLYTIADADLKQLADDLQNTIARDAADFATRNVAAPQLTTFDALITTFDDTTTDVELKGMITDAVEKKKALVTNLHGGIRTIRSMAEQAYGGKGKYKVFGFDDLTEQSDNDLYRTAKRVVRVGTSLQADLALQGLQASQLTDIATQATNLDVAIDAVHDAEEKRDMQTQDRIRKGNALYKEMSRLASIGKSLYQDKDEAKYNDYVLIGSRATPDDNDTSPTV